MSERSDVARRIGRRGAVMLAAAVACFTALGATGAAAHPLGNFSISHLDALTLTPNRIVDAAVIDTAEIPTAQAAPTVDADGDGTTSTEELDAYGAAQCADLVADVAADVDGVATTFAVTSVSFVLVPGQAGLDTSRLECRLEAPVDLAVARTVHFTNHHLTDRVGWREINAVGEGTHITSSPVPQTSTTDGLRNYPVDLLASPLDVRDAELRVLPGNGPSTVSSAADTGPALHNTGLFTGIVDRVQRTFDGLVGRHELTLGVGLLAVALALLLGASHAVLPGHGKTVMAAYIAGRQGSVRDAVVVGATVTGTHTGGVLVLGAVLTTSTSLAGESVLGWLGLTSGLLVAALGFGLLRSAVRHRGSGLFGHGHTHHYDLGDDQQAHGHRHGHGQHSHGPGGRHHRHAPGEQHRHVDPPAVLGVVTDRLALSHAAVLVGVGADRRSDVPDALGPATSVLTPSRAAVLVGASAVPPVTASTVGRVVTASMPVPATAAGPRPTPAAASAEGRPTTEPRRVSRHGLIGMGVAGGLVPSPSALIILLSAIALGRTWFGIVLVFAYGLGMAATLTTAGLILVTVRDRLRRRTGVSRGRLAAAGRHWGRVVPYATAALVLVVGLGLAIRSLRQI